MAPVMAGKCQMESLKNGVLDLADIALLNDAIAVEGVNRQKWREAAQADAFSRQHDR